MKEKLGTRKVVYNDNSDIAISVKDLHKSFKLPTEHAGGLKQAIFNRLRGIKGYTEQKVLRGLDFEIKKGDLNGDSIVDSGDASNILAEYSRLSTNNSASFSPVQKIASDLDNNFMTDSSDASEVLKIYVSSQTAK